LLLDSTGEGIYGFDVAGRSTFANAAHCRMLGYGADEIVGKIRRIAGGERIQRYETERGRKDGCRITVSLTAAPRRLRPSRRQRDRRARRH
jgi:PAS domain-containing protein